MQEEVEQRVVTLAINCTKLTEQELKKALVKLLQQWKAHQENSPHGKMTVKQLAAQNRGLQRYQCTHQACFGRCSIGRIRAAYDSEVLQYNE